MKQANDKRQQEHGGWLRTAAQGSNMGGQMFALSTPTIATYTSASSVAQ